MVNPIQEIKDIFSISRKKQKSLPDDMVGTLFKKYNPPKGRRK